MVTYLIESKAMQSNAKCVMYVGMSHVPSLCKRKKTVHHPYLSDFFQVNIIIIILTQPYNHIIYPGVVKNVSTHLSKVSVVISCSIHLITILGAKENFLKSQRYLLFTNFKCKDLLGLCVWYELGPSVLQDRASPVACTRVPR